METPKDIIEERQHALAGPDGAPVSQRELARLTDRFKGGPLASSTVSRWASTMPGKAREEQLELFARATADAQTPWETIHRRLRAAFGTAVEVDAAPWVAPAEVEQLTTDQKRWLTDTVRMLARTNRRIALEERDGEREATPPTRGQQ